MLSLIRILFFAFIFYLIYKGIRSIFIGKSAAQKRPYNDGMNVNKSKKKSSSSIDKKDIIEAEFVEIKDDKDKAND